MVTIDDHMADLHFMVIYGYCYWSAYLDLVHWLSTSKNGATELYVKDVGSRYPIFTLIALTV